MRLARTDAYPISVFVVAVGMAGRMLLVLALAWPVVAIGIDPHADRRRTGSHRRWHTRTGSGTGVAGFVIDVLAEGGAGGPESG